MSENKGKRGERWWCGESGFCAEWRKQRKKEGRKGWKPAHHKRENKTIHTQTHTHSFSIQINGRKGYSLLQYTHNYDQNRTNPLLLRTNSLRTILPSISLSFIHTFIHPTFFIHIAEQRDRRRYCVMTHTHRKPRPAFHITLNHNGSLFTLCKIESSSIESKCSASLSEIPQHMLHLVLIWNRTIYSSFWLARITERKSQLDRLSTLSQFPCGTFECFSLSELSEAKGTRFHHSH